MKFFPMKRKEANTIDLDQLPLKEELVALVDLEDFPKVDLVIYLVICLEIFLVVALDQVKVPTGQPREMISNKS